MAITAKDLSHKLLNKSKKSFCCSKNKYETFFDDQTSLGMTSDRKYYLLNQIVGICKNCGLILSLNREKFSHKKFYENYKLHKKNFLQENMIFYKNGISIGENQYVFNLVFKEIISKKIKNGSCLEIGAGKGVLLNMIKSKLNNWTFDAIEPSPEGFNFLKKKFNNKIGLDKKNFENSIFLKKKYDLVIFMGVLEHVENPYIFIKHVRHVLKPEGYALLGVPNFENKPDDLIVSDHLTKFTQHSLNKIYDDLGFNIIRRDISKKKIWMFDIIKPIDLIKKKTFIYEKNLSILKNNIKEFKKKRKGFQNYLKFNKEKKDFLYGLGNVGLYFHKVLSNNKLSKILIDNTTYDNDKFYDVKIKNLEKVNINIPHVYISANPCYHEVMIKKLMKAKFKGKIFF